MKVNYSKILELNIGSLHGPNQNSQLSCFYLIQQGVERYLNGDTINADYIKFLIEVGVLIPEDQEEKKIVKPFNFTGNDGPQGN